jgi:hypothetical protein
MKEEKEIFSEFQGCNFDAVVSFAGVFLGEDSKPVPFLTGWGIERKLFSFLLVLRYCSVTE